MYASWIFVDLDYKNDVVSYSFFFFLIFIIYLYNLLKEWTLYI